MRQCLHDSTRVSVRRSWQPASAGRKATALAPPAYGIDFVDRGHAGPAAVQRKECSTPEPRSDSASCSSHLPPAVQRRMEAAFQTDFSDVTINADSSKATELGALAFTRANEVHFAPGQYRPHTMSGQELIGHELAHVVQQREGRVSATRAIGKVAINDQESLERQADRQGRLAAEGKPARDHVVTSQASHAVPLQRKAATSFPDELTDEQLVGEKKRQSELAQMKRPGGPAWARVVQMKRADSAVAQMRGGATVGRLCIVSNVISAGLTAGHAWLSYTPSGGAETTYGTWGNRTPIGLHRDLELGRPYATRRCTDLDAADKSALDSFATANNAWSYTNNCASFAARGWLAVTGEHVPYTTLGIPNPSALGAGIRSLGGTLAAGTGGGSSASSGSSYGSSSLGSVGPGSSSGS
jgi:hypothetical protein